MPFNRANRGWVIFDADNTLWPIEHFYDESRDELCKFLSTLGIDSKLSEAFQRRRDKQLSITYGYSACRFARSFEDTLLHFFPESNPEDVRHVRSLAMIVFERPVEAVSGLEQVFQRIAEIGYEIAIITAGERWVQERRLANFQLQHMIADTTIVESKNENTFRDFAFKHSIDIPSSWVIGDSRRSDIEPADAVGFRTILVRANNWTAYEGDMDRPLPAGTIQLRRLHDLLDLVEFRTA